MDNFAIDPRPFVPFGFEWQPRVAPREPRRMRVFLGPSGVKTNENLAIALTVPSVASEDFHVMAGSLQAFLQEEHQVRELEIWRCPVGEAFVRFGCPLERQRFLNGPPLQFGQYQLRFIKHDEGCNARAIDMDQEAWLMLLYYPNDYRSDAEIDKALSGFAILKHIHRSSNVARVVVKVLVNKIEDIPDAIVVSPGDSPRAPSWTVPVFLLHSSNLTALGDEDAPPHEGPLHPLPENAPGWMNGQGDLSQANSQMNEEASVGNIHGHASAGHAPMEGVDAAVAQDGVASAAEQPGSQAGDGVDAANVENVEAAAAHGAVGKEVAGEIVPSPQPAIRFGPVSPFSGASTDFAASGGVKAPSVPLKVVEDEPNVVEQFSDVEILDKMPARKGPKKRRARKARGPLDFGGLRRSTRLKKPHGFKTDAAACSASPSAAAPVVEPAMEKEPAEMLPEPRPLEMVLPGGAGAPLVPYVRVAADPDAPPAPHLSAALASGIGTQFLKMQPGAVSEDVLMADSSDDE
ncbi:unnamed protein product [Urochloa humidicola]